MKKLVLICIAVAPILCGCSMQSRLETEPVSNYTVCIDGIEYIKYEAGYRGYLAPHLTSDDDNNPKVIRCGR